MILKDLLRSSEKFVIDNSPGILTGLGVAGTVTTAALATRAAYRIGKDENAAHYEPLLEGNPPVDYTYKQLVQIYWREFIPPAIVGVATVTAIVAANRVGTRRAAAVAAAYKISEQMAEEYRAKIAETFGVKPAQDIDDKLAAERIANTPGSETIIISGAEAVFFDEFSGRYFRAEMENVRKAVNEINFEVNNNFYASLTDFYDKIGLPRTEVSDEFGWNSDQLLEVRFNAVLMKDDRPAISIAYNKAPIRHYDRVN